MTPRGSTRGGAHPGFEDRLVDFLQGGCALIVGTVDGSGAPYAARAWGIRVVSRREQRLRLLLGAGDRALDHLADGGAVAVTGADVRTFDSAQVKGYCTGVEAATDADDRRAQRFVDAFFAAIEETDGTPRVVLDRLVPPAFVAATITVDEVFDQTPGPDAGRCVSQAPR